MKRDENGNDAGMDSRLAAAYRNLAGETSPPRLDRRILDDAARATRPAPSGFWRDAWFRPVVFAATFGLSLALILQLSDSGLIGPPAENAELNGSYVAPVDNPMRDAAAVTAERIRQLEAETAVPPAETPMPAASMAPTTAPRDLNSRLDADARCSEAQRADTGSWWRCIEDLEQRGLSGAAEAELQALLAAHPGFSAPE
jgi:hypothetical protein